MYRFLICLLPCLLVLAPATAAPAMVKAEVQVAVKKATLRVTAVTSPNTPWHDSWLYFEQQLARQPQLLEPVFYLAGQLGSEESALSQLRRGRVQMGGFSLQGASAVVPELGLLMSPYLFDSFAEVDFAMDNYLLRAFDKLFAEKGLVLLSWAEVGWTSLYSSTPVLTPQDSHGLKLRSSNALASQLFVQSIGADMVPMTFPDIMPSLQTGLIQGGESSAIFYALTGLPREAPNLTLTRHAFDSGMYLANLAWFDSLAEEQRNHLRESLMRAPAFRKLVRNYEAQILNHPAEYGITLWQPDIDQLLQWRTATAANRKRLARIIGGDSQRIMQLLDRSRQDFASRTGAAAL
jgi:TRAP-type C4-dicarboxylate transport system substrate-binding protein